MKIVLVTMWFLEDACSETRRQCTVTCENPDQVTELGSLLGMKTKEGQATITGFSLDHLQSIKMSSHYDFSGFRVLFY